MTTPISCFNFSRAVDLRSSLGKGKLYLVIIEIDNTDRKNTIVGFYVVACAIKYVTFNLIILFWQVIFCVKGHTPR